LKLYIFLYLFLQAGDECCAPAHSAECRDACATVFHSERTPTRAAREAVLEACAERSPRVLQCVKNHTKLTPAHNTDKCECTFTFCYCSFSRKKLTLRRFFFRLALLREERERALRRHVSASAAHQDDAPRDRGRAAGRRLRRADAPRLGHGVGLSAAERQLGVVVLVALVLGGSVAHRPHGHRRRQTALLQPGAQPHLPQTLPQDLLQRVGASPRRLRPRLPRAALRGPPCPLHH